MSLFFCRVRFGWMGAVIGLGFCLAAGAARAQVEASNTGTGGEGWGPLHLVETTIAGTKVYYQPDLEPNLPMFERELTRFVADRQTLSDLVARRGEIIADINRLLGVTDPNAAEQEKSFSQAVGLFSQMELTFYLAKQSTIKDALRGGSRLPSFTYDRATDSASYEPRLNVPAGTKPPKTWDFCIPVAEGKDFTEQMGILIHLGQFFGSGLVDIAIHEVTELTLVHKARPKPPYGRWFNDGVANAITCRLVEKYRGAEAAARFADAYDPNDYRDVEQQINLRYWLLGGFGIYTTEVPVKAESRISHARYTFSTFEARRLIDRHGIDCIRQILDRIAALEDRGDIALIQVIKEVTGEDMSQRLLHYQTFILTEDGISKYVQLSKTAQSRQDIEQTFITQMRLLELRSGTPSNVCLEYFLGASLLLFKMGHEAAAEEAMQNCLRTYSNESIVHGRQGALEAYIVYALDCGTPRKAQAFADELLQVAPDHVMSLAVRMLISEQDQDLAQARDYARRICALAKQDSTPYRVAARILANDPNAPRKGEESSEQR